MESRDPPPDVSLLLLAHSEHDLLHREVLPVVRQLEHGGRLPADQLPAAAAYLEVMWAQARARACATDAALLRLAEGADAPGAGGGHGGAPGADGGRGGAPGCLEEPAPRSLLTLAPGYHASVRALREALARRAAPLLAADYAAAPSAWMR